MFFSRIIICAFIFVPFLTQFLFFSPLQFCLVFHAAFDHCKQLNGLFMKSFAGLYLHSLSGHDSLT